MGFKSNSRIFHSWRRHHYRWRASKFDLCSALMDIEHWGFLNIPHLLWHKSSVYNASIRGLVTLTPVGERLAVELSQSVFTAYGFKHPTFRLRDQRSNWLRHSSENILIGTKNREQNTCKFTVSPCPCNFPCNRVFIYKYAFYFYINNLSVEFSLHHRRCVHLVTWYLTSIGTARMALISDAFGYHPSFEFFSEHYCWLVRTVSETSKFRNWIVAAAIWLKYCR